MQDFALVEVSDWPVSEDMQFCSLYIELFLVGWLYAPNELDFCNMHLILFNI